MDGVALPLVLVGDGVILTTDMEAGDGVVIPTLAGVIIHGDTRIMDTAIITMVEIGIV